MTTILGVACFVLAMIAAILWFIVARLRRRIAVAEAAVVSAQADAQVQMKFAAKNALEMIEGARRECEIKIAGARVDAQEGIADAQQLSNAARLDFEKKTALALQESQARVSKAQGLIDELRAKVTAEGDRFCAHYEAEAKRIHAKAMALIDKYRKECEELRKYRGIMSAEAEATRILEHARFEAHALQTEAQELLEAAKSAAKRERLDAGQKAKELRDQADRILDRATRDAGRIAEEAHKRAEKIAGDAYLALRNKEALEQAAIAMQNVIDGYGDRYIIPTRSILDDLAADFGHTEAGASLAAAREQTQRMVEEGQAGACDYLETNRREKAVRFVIDAFNGRTDAILSRSRHDNMGTLQQEIRDVFAIVNEDGKAFRNARILPAYLDARLSELKWAVVVHELRLKEREEQRRIKEQMREEEKARREYERAIKDAQEEENAIKKAIEKARLEVEKATAEERARYEREIAQLNEKLVEAEAKNERAVSMAEKVKKGNVYVISNPGSFGEGVYKIGMTRRLDPDDRIRELGDASVPFQFDVHAMIPTEDAPALENELHQVFDDMRINKVNPRKEFFRVALESIRDFVTKRGFQISFTMLAEAHEYRETVALSKMSAKERERYQESGAVTVDAGE